MVVVNRKEGIGGWELEGQRRSEEEKDEGEWLLNRGGGGGGNGNCQRR